MTKIFLKSTTFFLNVVSKRGEDPEFPERDTKPKWGGVRTYYLAKLSHKLRKLVRVAGDARPKFYYVDPPLLKGGLLTVNMELIGFS